MTITSIADKKQKKSVWIAGIARGHNAGVCLLKDGEVVFSIEEERLSRQKYDGGPFASMVKILEYTDKLDYIVVAHTQNLQETAGKIDYTGDDVYTGLARKLGLIDRKVPDLHKHPQVIDLSFMHHKLHAACAYYRSGWTDAVALIVDGAGTFYPMSMNGQNQPPTWLWEVESIVNCEYPANFKTLYKHYGARDPIPGVYIPEFDSSPLGEDGETHEAWISDHAGIVKCYEAVTEYCGFSAIEAGKTMGLFPYGKENPAVPAFFDETSKIPLTNRNLFVPRYPMSSTVNMNLFDYIEQQPENPHDDVTYMDNRRDMAYAVQTQTQEQVLRLIRKAAKMSGKKRVVISGGYGLNCVANYWYLEQLKDDGIEIYVEPISNDAGTAMGAAMMFWHGMQDDMTVRSHNTLYLGLPHSYTNDEISSKVSSGETLTDATYKDVVKLLREKNIVTIFQGRSENGPRALGNRSVLFDPTFEDGKDYVNMVKRREYFRPFAGTILQDDVHEWFDLRGMKDSPFMMYAVNCQPGVAEKIPSIIHVDGTCRIQTVTQEQNQHYYNLIKAFKEETGIPILFNTSFNLGGEPLVETLDDAIWTLRNSDIEYLFLPEYGKLVHIPNKSV
jgi:carbamoyltransferase